MKRKPSPYELMLDEINRLDDYDEQQDTMSYGVRPKVWDHPKAEQWRKEMEALIE